MKKYYSKSLEETKEIAANFAKSLNESTVVLFDAEMGAGKTSFTQGFGKGLGVKRIINSPTFNLVKIYQGERFTLNHLDCYRLENIKTGNGLSLIDFITDPNAITLIEWPQYLYDDLKLIKNHYLVTIRIVNETEREITIDYVN